MSSADVPNVSVHIHIYNLLLVPIQLSIKFIDHISVYVTYLSELFSLFYSLLTNLAINSHTAIKTKINSLRNYYNGTYCNVGGISNEKRIPVLTEFCVITI